MVRLDWRAEGGRIAEVAVRAAGGDRFFLYSFYFVSLSSQGPNLIQSRFNLSSTKNVSWTSSVHVSLHDPTRGRQYS